MYCMSLLWHKSPKYIASVQGKNVTVIIQQSPISTNPELPNITLGKVVKD